MVTNQPATLVPNGLNQVYGYDSFGNILQNGSFNSSYTPNNQMFGYSYDAAGNLLSNGLNTMTWDAENRIISTGGATYVYDAEGNRVEKQGVGVTDTIYFGGRPIARYSAGSWTDLIYGPNGLLAEVPGTENAETIYRITDHLGTQIGMVGNNRLLIHQSPTTRRSANFSLVQRMMPTNTPGWNGTRKRPRPCYVPAILFYYGPMDVSRPLQRLHGYQLSPNLQPLCLRQQLAVELHRPKWARWWCEQYRRLFGRRYGHCWSCGRCSLWYITSR